GGDRQGPEAGGAPDLRLGAARRPATRAERRSPRPALRRQRSSRRDRLGALVAAGRLPRPARRAESGSRGSGIGVHAAGPGPDSRADGSPGRLPGAATGAPSGVAQLARAPYGG